PRRLTQCRRGNRTGPRPTRWRETSSARAEIRAKSFARWGADHWANTPRLCFLSSFFQTLHYSSFTPLIENLRLGERNRSMLLKLHVHLQIKIVMQKAA